MFYSFKKEILILCFLCAALPVLAQTSSPSPDKSSVETIEEKYIISIDEQDFKADTIVSSAPAISILSASGIYEIQEFHIIIDGATVLLERKEATVDEKGRDKINAKLSAAMAMPAGRHEIEITIQDFEDQITIYKSRDILVFTGEPRLYGKIEVVPKSFNPQRGEVAFINYKVTRASDIEFYLYASNGELILKHSYLANEDGGRVGANSLIWDGYREYGEMAFPGDYYFRLIAVDGKRKSVLGRGMIKIEEEEKKS